ncbi:hypothetical protein Cgig2_032325 [Carnegiea gigantea]|uniref:Uncharacterized protein n=1 Tax=Carnegiea gigantea TaxID=171969 RepID=A0A9Q1KJ87_9CARY|nr:hypothetical protein Cgig2_032325 [Carnegiea gigantea]
MEQGQGQGQGWKDEEMDVMNLIDLLVLLVTIATITVAAEVRTSSRPHLFSLWASTLTVLPFIPPSISHVDDIQVLFLLNPHLGHPFMLLEIAHSTVTEKVSSTNPSTRTRASVDLLLARFNECLYDRYDHHGHDNKHGHEDCNYKGNVTELYWRSSRGGGELRRIIGDKEIVDMAPKLRKCNIVHTYVIDKPLQGLTLPLVTYNFVDESEHDTHKEELNKGKVPSTQFPMSWTLIKLESVHLDAQKQNDGVIAQEDNDTRNSQKDNDTTNAQKENVHDILQPHSDKEKGCENSASNDALIGGGKQTVTKNAINPSENDFLENEARISAERRKRKRGIASRPRGRNKAGKDGKAPSIAEIFKATRKRKDGTLNEEDAALYIMDESEKNPSMSQFELVEKYFEPQNRDRVICSGGSVKPKDIRGPEPSKANLKAELQQKKKQLLSELTNRVVNIEQLEASYQKKISDMEASHQRDIGELLKSVVLQQ